MFVGFEFGFGIGISDLGLGICMLKRRGEKNMVTTEEVPLQSGISAFNQYNYKCGNNLTSVLFQCHYHYQCPVIPVLLACRYQC